MPGETTSVDDVAQWILDISTSDDRDAKRQEILAYLRRAISADPSADHWYLVGHAIYHLWKPPLDVALLADGLEALNRALRLDPGHEWARLHRIYLEFESGSLANCLADARVLDRSWFLGAELEWRVISADEIEFACLVRLDMQVPRLEELYRSIVELATPHADELWPYRPTIFLESLEDAWSKGMFSEMDTPGMKAEIAELVRKVDA